MMDAPLPRSFTDVFILDEKQKQVLRKCEMELQRVAAKLKEYQFLYQDTVLRRTLVDAAATFFALHQESLTADILQSLARLYDPGETGRGKNVNENCSLYWLADNLPEQPTDAVRKNLLQILDAGKADREALRKWRDKFGSHTDYKHAMKIEDAPEILVSSISDLVKKTGNLLNYVKAHAEGPSYDDVDYDPDVVSGAKDLIALLRDGLAYRRQQEKH